ncbi:MULTISPECIES: thiamine pyrophosphate-binding protein [unclassified Streptomyces]|uniref:thiamine pyrophosphate-binding protein n=1 Tax=unclassified Streptomyces TaxID=2593676 RepID=UPI001BE9855C|nr:MULTISPECIES: thiamine pyrophosphate-binding protein [unclassified Streptomyces]MBT2407221.1 thiamine pyrophosphate-binding protein [Streptomyces sp. ISL-21]MBT2455671.1 thiamine pyrophosphate-binding protein [Streptomyces sp. ISL-86]MBT2612110.1 thiamine pyrophosphate-binding protein [Streptomyces sp. ISL-87]
MEATPGRERLIEQFKADGLNVMFGNPGTVEQGFLDAVDAAEDFRYILALQETVAAGIADGYARATGGAALLQLHSGVGLGNGIGMLYQSLRGHTPLVVVAGDAGVRYDAMDAQMASDLVAMAKPVTKYATRVTDPRSVLRTVRRAVKIALTPPRGPVFVALPMDVLDELNSEPVLPATVPLTDVAPSPASVGRAAELLASAERPVVLIGDGVSLSGAQAELVAVAELLGADVYEVDSSEVNIAASHPLRGGQTGHMFGPHSKELVGDADGVLIVGTYVFPEVFPELESPFRAGAKVVHIDLNAYEIAKNHPVDLGLAADPKQALRALAGVLEKLLTPRQRAAAAARLDTRTRERARATLTAVDAGGTDGTPMAVFLRTLAERTAGDLIVFDEALTTSPLVTKYLPPERPGDYHLTRGGSLGVGFPGAVGAKLAHPDRLVVGFAGDGGSMYTYQALWTAARHGIEAKFVVCNNRKYRLLDDNIAQYWRERDIPEHGFPGSFDLSHPEIDFAALARSLGAGGIRVEKPDEAVTAVTQMLAHPGPFLVDIQI